MLALAQLPAGAIPTVLAAAGPFHVLVLHLPIGILLCLPIVELRAPRAGSSYHLACSALSFMGAAGAVAAAGLGVLLGSTDGWDPQTLSRHQWLGIATAVTATGAFVLRRANPRHPPPRAYAAVLSLSLVCLVLGSHLGGTLTHGPSFLWSSSTGTESEITAAHVLQGRCLRCHGPDKTRSELRVDRRESLLAGGKSGSPAVVPGDPTQGALMNRVRMPHGEEGSMPPGHNPRLTAEEVLALNDWILAGAPELQITP